MKWVRCLYDGAYWEYTNITRGNVYEVIDLSSCIFGTSYTTGICIINDLGKKYYYPLYDNKGNLWFEDITAEIRDNKINEILG